MESIELLTDAFERIRDGIHPAVNGLSAEELAFRPDAESNSIAWLAWHLTRIQDDHVADLAGIGQRWLDGGWSGTSPYRSIPRTPATAMIPDQVAAVQADARTLLDYFEDVHGATLAYLATLTTSTSSTM